MKKMVTAVLIGLSLTQLVSGCAALAVGGIAAGSMSALDRRSTGAQADDQMMELQASNTINAYLKEQNGNNAYVNVKVISYNRNILLIGIVPTQEAKDFAERVARSQTAANRVYNHITVGTAREVGTVQDTWLTSKVRAMLLKPQGYSPNHVKITSFNGVTYVQGVLTPEEQTAVSQQISTTLGVQKVVTLYETFNAATNTATPATETAPAATQTVPAPTETAPADL